MAESGFGTATGTDRITGTVGIIGLGLVGGSLARDLAAAGVPTVGCDADPAAVHAACAAGAIANDGTGDRDDAAGAGFAAVCQADVVVLAVPVSVAVRLLGRVAERCTAARLITDTGSTKATLEQAAVAAGVSRRFVGGHPLAGAAHSGWAASRTDLFRGVRVWLCPAPHTDAVALTLAHRLWHAVGATTEVTDAASHDAELAGSSHLPQLLATALALTLERRGVRRERLGAGGLDMTRLAGSSPEMWTAICQANGAHIGPAIDQFAETLHDLQRLLAAADGSALAQRFAAGRRWARGTPDDAAAPDANPGTPDAAAGPGAGPDAPAGPGADPGARVAPGQPPKDQAPAATA